MNDDYSVTANNYSWDKLADYVWIDQPVGTGYSTADKSGYGEFLSICMSRICAHVAPCDTVADEDQMGVDFVSTLLFLLCAVIAH